MEGGGGEEGEGRRGGRREDAGGKEGGCGRKEGRCGEGTEFGVEEYRGKRARRAFMSSRIASYGFGINACKLTLPPGIFPVCHTSALPPHGLLRPPPALHDTRPAQAPAPPPPRHLLLCHLLPCLSLSLNQSLSHQSSSTTAVPRLMPSTSASWSCSTPPPNSSPAPVGIRKPSAARNSRELRGEDKGGYIHD